MRQRVLTTILALSATLAACTAKPVAKAPAAAAALAPATSAGGQSSGMLSAPSGLGQAAALGTAAPAMTAVDSGTVFTDPTEHAFTVSVPAGWQVRGGVQRSSPVAAKPWVQATSQDGSMAVFMGDASIPLFVLPSAQHAQGSSFDGVAGKTMAYSYMSGAQFAAGYVQNAKPCADLQQVSSQPEPDVAGRAQARAQADTARTNSQISAQTQFDGGSAVFSCQMNGRPFVAAAIVATALTRFGPGGVWSVAVIFGYRAPADRQAEADRIARAMQASYRRDPRWEQAMDVAVRQAVAGIQAKGAQDRQTLQAQADRNSALLRQQGEDFSRQQQARQDAYMNQTNAQRDARNAAWAQQMNQKDINQQREMRYIQNQTCAVWWDAAHTRCKVVVGN